MQIMCVCVCFFCVLISVRGYFCSRLAFFCLLGHQPGSFAVSVIVDSDHDGTVDYVVAFSQLDHQISKVFFCFFFFAFLSISLG